MGAGAAAFSEPAGAGARFGAGERDWDGPGWGQGPGGPGGPGWTEWPGRRGWEDWARMRGRGGWPGALDFGTLRDLERVAIQFTSDLRKLAMQSTSGGENVISDLRGILEDALDRVKSEIFGPGREAPGKRGSDSAPADSPGAGAGQADTPPAGTRPADASAADTPPADASGADAPAADARSAGASSADASAADASAADARSAGASAADATTGTPPGTPRPATLRRRAPLPDARPLTPGRVLDALSKGSVS